MPATPRAQRHRPHEPAPGNAGGGSRMDEARGARVVVALVFAGGDPPEPGLASHLDRGALVIARRLGRRARRRRSAATSTWRSATSTRSHPRRWRRPRRRERVCCATRADKDATDLELALDVASARGATRVTVVGGHGGRARPHAREPAPARRRPLRRLRARRLVRDRDTSPCPRHVAARSREHPARS